MTDIISCVAENKRIKKKRISTIERNSFLVTEPEGLQNVCHLCVIALLCMLNITLLLHVKSGRFESATSWHRASVIVKGIYSEQFR